MSAQHVTNGPIITAARTVWFHDDDLPNALHAAACWIHDHHDDGCVTGLLLQLGARDADGHDAVLEEPGAVERWFVAVVQDR